MSNYIPGDNNRVCSCKLDEVHRYKVLPWPMYTYPWYAFKQVTGRLDWSMVRERERG